MDKDFWNFIGIAILIANSLSIVILFETIVFKKPLISVFIVILFIMVKVNLELFKKKSKGITMEKSHSHS